MSKFIGAVKKFVREEEGATMVEYAIMVALIAVVSIITVTALGVNVDRIFGVVDASLSAIQ